MIYDLKSKKGSAKNQCTNPELRTQTPRTCKPKHLYTFKHKHINTTQNPAADQ